MKQSRFLLLIIAILSIGIISACTSLDTANLKLDEKHLDLPDYVTNSPKKVEETYVLAAQYPEVLESVPCYCGCGAESGHENNLDCFVVNMDGDQAVTEWTPHGTAWDVCVNIAREAVMLKQDGKDLKKIHETIVDHYSSFGEGTPTPVPAD